MFSILLQFSAVSKLARLARGRRRSVDPTSAARPNGMEDRRVIGSRALTPNIGSYPDSASAQGRARALRRISAQVGHRPSSLRRGSGARSSHGSPLAFAATPPAFTENISPTRPANFVTSDSILKQANASGDELHGFAVRLTSPIAMFPRLVPVPPPALRCLRSRPSFWSGPRCSTHSAP
jgi:hypothetical protein